MTVAPLTAAVLADADETDAGIASAINNAVARIAGLVGVSVIGVVVASRLVGDTFAAEPRVGPSVPRGDGDLRRRSSPREGSPACGDRQPEAGRPRRECPGGQLAGAPEPAAAADVPAATMEQPLPQEA